MNQESLIEIGTYMFGAMCPFLIFTYRRKISNLKTYIGINKLLNSITETIHEEYSKVIVEEFIQKDLSSNKNNMLTIIMLYITYLFILNDKANSLFVFMPTLCLVIVFYYNHKYKKYFESYSEEKNEKA